jgi:hypothetical protein
LQKSSGQEVFVLFYNVFSKRKALKVTKMSTAQAQVSMQRAVVEQLRGELKVNRMKVSQTSADLMKFCEQNIHGDPLVNGVSASENPFREKNVCAIL